MKKFCHTGLLILSQLLIMLLAVILVGCGSSSSSSSGTDSPGNNNLFLQTDTTIGTHPHTIDIYGVTHPRRAFVFLHGGGGSKTGFACNLGMLYASNCNTAPEPTSSADFNATWLEDNQAVALFPQGQAKDGGTPTWSNHVMTSGVDDMAFLGDLVTYVKSAYGNIPVYLAGHSNGGMMASRVWCENPGLFNGYIAISGPPSEFYLANPDQCQTTSANYYAIVGSDDTVLESGTIGAHWTDSTWTIAPLYVAAGASQSWVDPTMKGGWVDYQNKAQTMCGEIPDINGYSIDGNVDTWENCVDSVTGHPRLKLQRIEGASHAVSSLQSYLGATPLLDRIADYAESLEP